VNNRELTTELKANTNLLKEDLQAPFVELCFRWKRRVNV